EQPDQQAAYHRAGKAAEAADDHDDERVGQHFEVCARVDAEEAAADDAAERGQAGAQREHAERHQRHIDAHAARHLAVVDRGANRRAEPRPLEQEPETQTDGDGDRDDENSIRWKRQAARAHRAGQHRWRGNRVGVTAPDEERQVLEDQREADGHQHLAQGLAGQAPQEQALHPDPDQSHRQGADGERAREAAGAPHRREADVASQHEVRAVGEIHHAHDAEDQRQPARQEEQERAVGHPVESLRDPQLRPRPVTAGSSVWRKAATARDSTMRAAGEEAASAAPCHEGAIVGATPIEEAPMRLPRERFDYSPMTERPRWKLPKGARIAVWTIVNVEEWDIEKAMARQYLTAPQGVATVPDVPNWAWHEYGMRVGFWRLLEALSRRKLRATTAINAQVCESYEPVARAMLD